MSVQIPVVDLDALNSPRVADQKIASDAIAQAFGQYGLIYIKNHGIEPQTLEAFYDAFIRFTDRPLDDKQALSQPDIWFQRGWTPPNTERAVIAGGQPDFKECYFAAPLPTDPDCQIQYPEVYAQNVWPSDDDDFRERYLDIGHQLQGIGLNILRGCARALGLEPFRFEVAAHGGPHVTRALRYLPVTQTQLDDKVVWGEEHTDFNLLTLLPGGRFLDANAAYCPRPDDQCGLYLRTRATPEHPRGQMLPGKPPAGCIVAQVGQQLEILSGGAFLATPHVIRTPASPGWSRVSMAHFIHLHGHQLLFPLPSLRNPDAIRAYSPPVLAGTYGTKTLVDIGLAPQEALHKLGYRHYDRLGEWRDAESKG